MNLLFRDLENARLIADYTVQHLIPPNVSYDARSLLGTVVDFSQFFGSKLALSLCFNPENVTTNTSRLATAHLYARIIDEYSRSMEKVSIGLVSCEKVSAENMFGTVLDFRSNTFQTVSIDFLIYFLGQTDLHRPDLPSLKSLANLFRAAIDTSTILLEREINQ